MRAYRAQGTQYLVISFVIALMLDILPLPHALMWWRPSFVLLTLIYWAMNMPYRVNVGIAFLLGVLVDLFLGNLLGMHAFAFVLIIYLVVKFQHALKLLPLLQQTLFVFFFLIIQQIVFTIVQSAIHQAADTWLYSLSLLSSTVIWPLVFSLLNAVVSRYKIS